MTKEAVTETENMSAIADASLTESNNETTQQFERTRSEVEQWRKEDLARSGLTENDIATAIVMPKGGKHSHNGGYDILFRDPATGEDMRGMNGKAFRRTRYRPPLPKDKNGKGQRYRSPCQSGNHCYIPNGAHMALNADSGMPLYLTEGEKKAAKANKSGFPVIGLTGIWNWLDSAANRKTEKGNNYEIHPDLTRYLSVPRQVFLIYDSDATENSRKTRNFDANALRFSYELEKFDCPLFRVDLPKDDKGTKIGLDDYFLEHSAEDLKKYIREKAMAVPVEDLSDERLEDPYADLTERYGRPYLIKYNKSGTVSSATFNQRWTVAFFMRNYSILREPDENMSYRYIEESGLWQLVTENRLSSMLADDLSDYWREYHAAEADELIPRLNERMLRDSLLHLRGDTEKKDVFRKNSEAYVIHLRNGMLHLDSMEIRNFAKEYYSRNMIPFELDKNADCPRFMEELMYSALPEEDVDLLQRWAGTVLMGGNPSQQFMLVEGTAGGGKGTFAEVIETIVGYENVAEMRTSLLNERFELSAFIGKSLLCGKDVPRDFLQVPGAGAIKKLVGHDCLQAELKGSNIRSTIFGNFGMLVTSNDRLKVRLDGDADAWRRRILMVRYERPPVEKRIPGFARKLIKEEGQGILLWMVTGAVKAINDMEAHGRFSMTKRQQRMVDSVIFESDGLHRFVDECLEYQKGWDVTTEEIKSAYVHYCEVNGWNMIPGHNVERQLPDLILAKYHVHRSNSLMRNDKSARGYRGLHIKDNLSPGEIL